MGGAEIAIYSSAPMKPTSHGTNLGEGHDRVAILQEA